MAIPTHIFPESSSIPGIYLTPTENQTVLLGYTTAGTPITDFFAQKGTSVPFGATNSLIFSITGFGSDVFNYPSGNSSTYATAALTIYSSGTATAAFPNANSVPLLFVGSSWNGTTASDVIGDISIVPGWTTNGGTVSGFVFVGVNTSGRFVTIPVSTFNNILDDGSGNVYVNGTLTVANSLTSGNGTTKTKNNTLDDGSGNAYFTVAGTTVYATALRVLSYLQTGGSGQSNLLPFQAYANGSYTAVAQITGGTSAYFDLLRGRVPASDTASSGSNPPSYPLTFNAAYWNGSSSVTVSDTIVLATDGSGATTFNLGTNSGVSVQPTGTATSVNTTYDSNTLSFNASYWNGTAATNASGTIFLKVASTSGNTTFDLSSDFVSLPTISAGTWQGSPIGNSYLAGPLVTSLAVSGSGGVSLSITNPTGVGGASLVASLSAVPNSSLAGPLVSALSTQSGGGITLTATTPSAVGTAYYVPSVTIGGDLSGTALSDLTVASLQGGTLTISSPTANQVLSWNGSAWVNSSVPSSGAVTSLNGLTGIVVIASNGTLSVGTSGQNINVNLNLGSANAWTASQTFNAQTNVGASGTATSSTTTVPSYPLQFSASYWNGSAAVAVSDNFTLGTTTGGKTTFIIKNSALSLPSSGTATSSTTTYASQPLTLNASYWNGSAAVAVSGSLTLTTTTAGVISFSTGGAALTVGNLSVNTVVSGTWNGSAIANAYLAGPLATGLTLTTNNGITQSLTNPSGVGTVSLTLGLSGVPNSVLSGPLVTGLVTTTGLSVSNPTGVGTASYSIVLNGTTLSLVTAGLSLNLGNANTWTAVQTFGNNISFGGAQLSVSSLTTSQVLSYNGTNWVNSSLAAGTGISISGLTISNSGVTSLTAGNGISVSASTGGVTVSAVINGSTLSLGSSGLSINLANVNTWTGAQTFTQNVVTQGTEFEINPSGGTFSSYLEADSTNSSLIISVGGTTMMTFSEANGTVTTTHNTLDNSSGDISITGAYQINGTSIFASANTWTATQTFPSGSITNSELAGNLVSSLTTESGGGITLTATSPSGVGTAYYTPSVSIGGDLSGSSLSSLTLAAIQGKTVTITSPASGDFLYYNGTEWLNQALIAGSNITISGATISASFNPDFDDVVIQPTGTATSTQNYPSYNLTFESSTWNGSSAVTNEYTIFFTDTNVWQLGNANLAIPAKGTADSTTTVYSSYELLFTTSYWNGSAAVSVQSNLSTSVNTSGDTTFTISATNVSLPVVTSGTWNGTAITNSYLAGPLVDSLTTESGGGITLTATNPSGVGAAYYTPSVSIGGDLSGSSLSSLKVAELQGTTLTISSPSTNQVIVWNGTAWVNASVPATAGVTSLNSLTGALTIAAGTGITVTASTPDITISNSGVVSLTAGNGISVSSSTGSVTVSAVLNGATLLNGSSGLSLNLGNANTWTAVQTFGNNISFGGAQVSVATLTTNQLLSYNGTNWNNASLAAGTGISISGLTISNSGVTSLTAGNGISVSASTGGVTVSATLNGTTLLNGSSGLSLNLGNANTWTALQTFSSGITGTGNLGALTAGSGILPESVQETELTTTTATNVASYTPPAAGNYLILIYYRVVTATTAVSVSVNYDDVTGAQSYSAVSGSSAIGSYIVPPIMVNATTSAAIDVSFTAGTANQVYASVSYLRI